MTYIKKTSYFEVSPPGHTFVYKNINDIWKNDKYILICYMA